MFRMPRLSKTLRTVAIATGLFGHNVHADAQMNPLPCDWFDHNGDGHLGANTWLFVLGQYGMNAPGAGEAMDVDDSGEVGARDVLQFLPYFGSNCPVDWADTSSGQISGLHLVQHALHTTELAGLVDDLPAGSVTYRLYAELAQTTDRILAVYGDDESPLTFEATGGLYGFGEQVGGSIVVHDVLDALFGTFPALEYSSWLTLGLEPGTASNSNISVVGPSPDWVDMSAEGVIQWDDAIGGLWFDSGYGEGGNNGFVLLGQFTVIGDPSFSGVLNLLAETDSGQSIEFAEGLTFSHENLSVLGCMDVSALNFSPDATHEPLGACSYSGDFDGDGAFTVSDLLALIALFGCDDCPEGDLDGDGLVSVQDILTFLMLLG